MLRPQHGVDDCLLLALHIEQHQVGPLRHVLDPDDAKQVLLCREQRGEHEGAEAEREHHRHGLVGRVDAGWQVPAGQDTARTSVPTAS